MKLLLSQKNEIFEIIEYLEFSSLQFSFISNADETFIKYLNSNYYFEIKDTTNFNFSTIEFSPGEEYLNETYTCESWGDTINQFERWLDNLKRETELEDKWERFHQEMKSIEIPFGNDNSKFSFSEFEILKKNISVLKTKITTIGLTETQNNVIIGKLDYLVEQSKTMNKFDWKSLFIGSVITIIIQLAISHEQGLAIWGFIKQVFKNYLLP